MTCREKDKVTRYFTGQVLSLAVLGSLFVASAAHAATADEARWKAEASAVTITRDDWGTAHVHGKTDANAVFGMAYTQAEDDFNRVETNYLNSLGWLAKAEGEQAIWSDLRQQLWIDPVELKRLYAKSPSWLPREWNRTFD